MKEVCVTRVEKLPDISGGDTKTYTEFCRYLLTLLASGKFPAIYAAWDKDKNSAVWFGADELDFTIGEPKQAIEIVRMDNRAAFRSILARLGNFLIDDTYLGAGTFRLKIAGSPEPSQLFALIFSNLKETGFWMKLQRFDQNPEKVEKTTLARNCIREYVLSFLGFGICIFGVIVGFAGGMLLCLMGLERFEGLFGVEISKDTTAGIAAIAGLLVGGLPFGYLAFYWARRQVIIRPREAEIAKFKAEWLIR